MMVYGRVFGFCRKIIIIETEGNGMAGASRDRNLPAPRQEVPGVRQLLLVYTAKAKPKVDLSWGLDEFERPHYDNIKPYSKHTPVKPVSNSVNLKRKDEDEELDKIMKDFDMRKLSSEEQMLLMDYGDNNTVGK